jgi:hypothetical protein
MRHRPVAWDQVAILYLPCRPAHCHEATDWHKVVISKARLDPVQ